MKKLAVLVVDDDDAFRTLLKELLRAEGLVVECAANGREALAVLDRAHPQLIITDLVMPVMDGGELVRALQQDPRFERIPVVVLSAVPKAAPSYGVACAVDKNTLLDNLTTLVLAP